MKTGLSRFWYRFKNWFRTKPGLGEPLTFLCGSEEELRRVTTLFCHLYARYEEGRSELEVWYYATPQANAHGKQYGKFIVLPSAPFSSAESQKIRGWCYLLHKHCAFTGTRWARYTERMTYRRGLFLQERLIEIRILVPPLPPMNAPKPCSPSRNGWTAK